jgi:hypothetical protein
MSAVEKRISAQLKADIKQVDVERKQLQKEHAALVKEGAKLMSAQTQAWADLSENGVTTSPEPSPRLARVMRELATLNQKIGDANARHMKLTDEGEMARRVELASKLGVGDEPMSGPDAAKAVLLYHGKAMRVEDITRDMLEAGTVKLQGRTPAQTVSAYLAKGAKKGDTFVRISPGTFGLKKDDDATEKKEDEAAEPVAS